MNISYTFNLTPPHYGHKDGTLIGIWQDDHIEFIKEGKDDPVI